MQEGLIMLFRTWKKNPWDRTKKMSKQTMRQIDIGWLWPGIETSQRLVNFIPLSADRDKSNSVCIDHLTMIIYPDTNGLVFANWGLQYDWHSSETVLYLFLLAPFTMCQFFFFYVSSSSFPAFSHPLWLIWLVTELCVLCQSQRDRETYTKVSRELSEPSLFLADETKLIVEVENHKIKLSPTSERQSKLLLSVVYFIQSVYCGFSLSFILSGLLQDVVISHKIRLLP